MNILFASFNNYLNRIYRRYETTGEYVVNSISYTISSDINFNPGDGVATKLVVGKGTGAFLDWDKVGPNYAVVFEGSGDNTDGNKIASRWFILDTNRTRAGQYEITLKRDIVADLLTSQKAQQIPAQINKGIITDPDSPYLRNRETDVTVNEIKSPNEILLKDITRVPWLVLYLKKGVLGAGVNENIVNVPASFNSADYTLSTSIEQWPYYQYVSGSQGVDLVVANNYKFVAGYENQLMQDTSSTANNRVSYYYETDREGKYLGSKINHRTMMVANLLGTNLRWNVNLMTPNQYLVSMDSAFESRVAAMRNRSIIDFNLATDSQVNDLFRYDGKIVKDSNNKYFKISLVKTKTAKVQKKVNASDNASLYIQFTNAWNSGAAQSATPNNNAFGVQIEAIHYRLAVDEISAGGATLQLGACDLKTENSPLFDAICMPYGNITYTSAGEYYMPWTTSQTRAMDVMNAIATQLTSQKAFDLQILPYCPFTLDQTYVNTSGSDVFMISEDSMYVNNISKHGVAVIESLTGGGIKYEDMIFVCKSVNTSFDIQVNLDLDIFNYANSINDSCKRVKYVNDCTKLRICSPNYNGVFEFNLAKNNMAVDTVNVDITLRPYNPYIHLNPNFSGLYGADTDDQRGLICGGDFSLGTLDSAWAQYELQNRNYQAIFDRQIQNLDVQQDVQLLQSAMSAAGGTVQGGAIGAAMGSKAGPYGAIAGAAVGAALGAAGGAADVYNTIKLQREQKSYMKDNYALQLGNVKALPNSITKTSALTLNNKFWPFIEIYECTEQEKDAFINKITYDGMTVGVIDTLANWTTFSTNVNNLRYLQARIVRNPNTILIDNHELDDLNEELMKGIYI